MKLLHYLTHTSYVFLTCLIVSLFGIQELHATHGMGADITYSCLGANTYQVNLTFFRDCSGITPLTTQNLRYSSATCGVSSSIILSQPSAPVDVTPICPTETSACSSGGTSSFGIEQYTYSGILTLPAGCGADWVLSWENCCRNFAITTLNIPGNQAIYVSALLDNTTSPCNNSPVFTNIATPIVCINQPVIYNHGVTDSDGDDLVFSLVDCTQDFGVPVTYGPGFSATNPLQTAGGVTLNTTTGEITFTPNQVQIGVICVRVEEYRSGVKIGETVRDMQFSVINCSNAPPIATGINGNSADFDIDLCVGSNVCFDILMSDANGDNITASWNNGIPTGIFTLTGNGGTSPTGTFCWVPTAADLGTHIFTVTLQDDACPLIGASIYSFEINVLSSTSTLSVGPDQTMCTGQSPVPLTASGPGAINFQWTPTTGLSASNVANPTASPSVTTVYTVTADFPDGCTAINFVTVTVNDGPSLSVSPPVSYICPGANATLTANAPTATSYLWTGGAGTNPSATVSPAVNTKYYVTVTDAAGCSSIDSVTVNVNTPGSNLCNVIYASPGASGAGTANDPASLLNAISMASCNDVLIKLDIGTYTIDNPITNILGNLTLEGGFDQANSWRKTSLPGASTIHRSTLNPEGAAGQRRLVAFALANASNFRFQDVTITTANATEAGMSTYGVHLTSCSNYDFARCQILPGDGGDGIDGGNGTNGLNGQNGGNGDAGHSDDKDWPGEGGNGGNGGGSIGTFGTGGLGGTDQNGTNNCCTPGDPGDNGAAPSAYRSGGGGGGGACGGEADESGGTGGAGGLGGSAAAGGTGGSVGVWGNPGGDGGAGNSGTFGTDGATGTVGSAGTHTTGFWVPGGNGGNGGEGEGGAGGGGGGGGGGQSGGGALFRGAGSGGGGGGGGGQGATGGTGGTSGGSSYAVYLYLNGAGGAFANCSLTGGAAGTAGIGGTGGTGGTGGLAGSGNTYTGSNGYDEIGEGGDGATGGNGGDGGNGGNGQSGESIPVYQAGGTLVSTTASEISFNLAGQPTILMENISCTNTDVDFTGPSSNQWNLGGGASPQLPMGTLVTSQYATVGRRNIVYGTDTYRGFAYIVQDNTLPDALTNAPLIAGEYKICAGTSLDFSALNGATGYIYHWDMDGGATPNTYVGDTYENLTTIPFNTPGTYDITLQYETDCCGLSSATTITIIVEEQPVLVLSGPTEFCAGAGGVTLNASGGTTYTWGPNLGLTSTTGTSVIANPTSTTTYTVTTLNASGLCFDSDAVTVTVNSIDASSISTAADCSPDGTATASVIGGSGSYSYAWNTSPVQTSVSATALSPGTYGVMVTDLTTGCIDSSTVYVNPDPTTLDTYILNSNGVTCNGGSNGSASVGVTGSVGVLSYSWAPSGSSFAFASGLSAGTHTVTVTDLSTTCVSTVSVTIPEPAPVDVALLSATNADCNNYAEATVNASGGNGPFNYSWNTTPVQTGNMATGLETGLYSVTVTDQNGCTDNLNVNVAGPQSPVALSFVSSTDASSCTDFDGQITISGTGSSGNISYVWDSNPAQTGPSATNLFPGSYTVTATGTNGCTDIMGITIGPICPLPVEMLYFNVTAKEDYLELKWETEVEEFNKGFEIERSTDGLNFEYQNWVDSRSLNGEGAQYLWNDNQVQANQPYFYRLKQVDFDGNFAYSDIREGLLTFNGQFSVTNIYPVPSQDKVSIELKTSISTSIELKLFNSLGQSVFFHDYYLNSGNSTIQVDMSDFSEGIYQGWILFPGETPLKIQLIKAR